MSFLLRCEILKKLGIKLHRSKYEFLIFTIPSIKKNYPHHSYELCTQIRYWMGYLIKNLCGCHCSKLNHKNGYQFLLMSSFNHSSDKEDGFKPTNFSLSSSCWGLACFSLPWNEKWDVQRNRTIWRETNEGKQYSQVNRISFRLELMYWEFEMMSDFVMLKWNLWNRIWTY